MKQFNLNKMNIIMLMVMINSPITRKMVRLMHPAICDYSLTSAVNETADLNYDPEEDLFEYNHFVTMPHNTFGWVTGSGNILILRDIDGRTFSAWCTGGNILQWMEDLDSLEGEDVLSLLDETD